MVTVKDTFRNGLKIKDCPLLPRMERWVLRPKQSSRLRLENRTTGREHVNTGILKVYVKFQSLTTREDGQDLVEYALLVSPIALAAITGVGSVASAVTTVFSNISTSIQHG